MKKKNKQTRKPLKIKSLKRSKKQRIDANLPSKGMHY